MVAVDTNWLSPTKIAEMSDGLLSAHQIRQMVDRAIEDPESELKSGVHYVRLQGRLKPRYRVSKKILEHLHEAS